MHRRSFTIFTIAAISLTSHVFGYNANEVNAKAVSVQWRHGQEGWSGLCCECMDKFPVGAIVVYTINDAQVTGDNTIYTRGQGMAHYPVFNLSGTQIAFMRTGRAPESSGTGCTSVNGGKNYISVVNTDGSGLTDLVEVAEISPRHEQDPSPLAWPAGDWIYYAKPYENSGSSRGLDIWRVNASNGQVEEVCNLSGGSDCKYLRRFTLSADGSKTGIQTMTKYECNSSSVEGGTRVWPFPIPGNDLSSGTAIFDRAGCNMAISPSGNIAGSYFSGAHTSLELGGGTPGTFDLGWGQGLPLSKVMEWSGEGDVGDKGCELPRWSANSDKWVLQNVGWHGHHVFLASGSNSFAANWIDGVAFNTTGNDELALDNDGQLGILYTNNCTGDMWIDDPENNPLGTKYEDLNGQWHDVPGATPVANPNRSPLPRHDVTVEIDNVSTNPTLIVGLGGADPARVSIADVRGRIVCDQFATGSVCLSTASFSPGTFVVSVIRDGNRVTKTVVVR